LEERPGQTGKEEEEEEDDVEIASQLVNALSPRSEEEMKVESKAENPNNEIKSTLDKNESEKR